MGADRSGSVRPGLRAAARRIGQKYGAQENEARASGDWGLVAMKLLILLLIVLLALGAVYGARRVTTSFRGTVATRALRID